MWGATPPTGLIHGQRPAHTAASVLRFLSKKPAVPSDYTADDKHANHLLLLKLSYKQKWQPTDLRYALHVCELHPRLRRDNLPPDTLAEVLRAFAWNTLAGHVNHVAASKPVEATLRKLKDAIVQGVDEDNLPTGGGVPQLEKALEGGMGDFHLLGALLRAFTDGCKRLRFMWTITAMEALTETADYKTLTEGCGSFEWESAGFERGTHAALQRVLVLVTTAAQVGDAIGRDLERATELRSSAALLLRAYGQLVPSRDWSDELRNGLEALREALGVPHPATLHTSWQDALQTRLASIFGAPSQSRNRPMNIAHTMLKVVRWAITMAGQVRVKGYQPYTLREFGLSSAAGERPAASSSTSAQPVSAGAGWRLHSADERRVAPSSKSAGPAAPPAPAPAARTSPTPSDSEGSESEASPSGSEGSVAELREFMRMHSTLLSDSDSDSARLPRAAPRTGPTGEGGVAPPKSAWPVAPPTPAAARPTRTSPSGSEGSEAELREYMGMHSTLSSDSDSDSARLPRAAPRTGPTGEGGVAPPKSAWPVAPPAPAAARPTRTSPSGSEGSEAELREYMGIHSTLSSDSDSDRSATSPSRTS